MDSMTSLEAYEFMGSSISAIYDAREASLIARYLTEDLFGRPFWSEETLTSEEMERLQHAIERLLTHEPWQYIGGKADFYGLQFYVDKRVLIPRPETEELVLLALNIIKKEKLEVVLDACTGSGIIAVVLSLKSDAQIYALDIDWGALEVAKENADLHNVHVHLIEADILNPSSYNTLPKVGMIVSNPPYITIEESGSLDPNVKDFEPHLALFSPGSPFLFYEALAESVIQSQEKGCWLLVEINERYGNEICTLLTEKGFSYVQLFQDMQGKDRFIVSCL